MKTLKVCNCIDTKTDIFKNTYFFTGLKYEVEEMMIICLTFCKLCKHNKNTNHARQVVFEAQVLF